MYWSYGSTRAILPDLVMDDKIFHPVASAFESYGASQFEFVVAEGRNPSTSTVHLSTDRTITYDVGVAVLAPISRGCASRNCYHSKKLNPSYMRGCSCKSRKVGVYRRWRCHGVEAAANWGRNMFLNGRKKLSSS